MTWASIQDFADKQVLHLTTIGRRTGLPREIEIWFVLCCERFYLLAETSEAAGDFPPEKWTPGYSDFACLFGGDVADRGETPQPIVIAFDID